MPVGFSRDMEARRRRAESHYFYYDTTVGETTYVAAGELILLPTPHDEWIIRKRFKIGYVLNAPAVDDGFIRWYWTSIYLLIAVE